MKKIKMRAVVFVDGSNFYHTMKEAQLSPTGLDFSKFSQKLVGDREWVETRFYIGQITKNNPVLYQGQQKFLSRLEQQGITVFFGRMEKRPVKGAARKLNRWLRRLQNHPHGSKIPVEIVQDLRQIAENKEFQWIEKAVDVMIATDMVSMAFENKYDVAYLLSADGDFTPAAQKVRETGRKIFVASPMPGQKISQAANSFIPLKREFFHGCWE